MMTVVVGRLQRSDAIADEHDAFMKLIYVLTPRVRPGRVLTRCFHRMHQKCQPAGRARRGNALLAKRLFEASREHLSLRIDQVSLEFTQQPGNEMYHPLLRGLSDDWNAREA